MQFLYCGEDEIGAVDKDGNIQQLRALIPGKHAEIGASVVLELNGCLYFPIHDLFGNVACLISEDGNVCEYSRFSAFGQEEGNGVNPWRFCSKRCDEETGFIFFGKRYYAPDLGRWTTLDPEGFRDGPNLYAYVHNSPLTHFDPYGLLTGEEHNHLSRHHMREFRHSQARSVNKVGRWARDTAVDTVVASARLCLDIGKGMNGDITKSCG